MFEVKAEDIGLLSPEKLQELLSRLISLEAAANALPNPYIHVSANINTADGGEDGRIKWQAGVDKTIYFPSRFVVFQCKAGDMPPSECKDEILRSEKTLLAPAQLKVNIETVLSDAEGSYVLFHSQMLNQKQIDERIRKFREALVDANKPYAQSAKIVILDANKIVAWVNNYMSAVTAVFEMRGYRVPYSLMTWKNWSGYPECAEFQYVPSDTKRTIISKLKQQFSLPKKAMRIVGLSGLGKTRLAVEAFRPDGTVQQKFLSDQVVYFNAKNSLDILADVPSWRERNFRGILIVDNCPASLHDDLEREVKHQNSKFSLLTLNYEPVGAFIKLEPETDDIIRSILAQKYGSELSWNDLTRIVQFAQGFPQMAALMAAASFSPDDHLAQLKDQEIIKRLVYGRGDVPEVAIRSLAICSLFHEVPFEKELQSGKKAYEIIANLDEILPLEMYQYIKYFEARGIVERTGAGLWSVKPKPLAFYLAADWLMKRPLHHIISFVQHLPDELQQNFTRQFSMLNFSSKAKEVVAELCKEGGLLSSIEILQLPYIVMLLSSVVEIAPELAKLAIRRLITLVDLTSVPDPSLRQIIFALEKLTFRADFFEEGLQLIFLFEEKLASTPNKENIKNDCENLRHQLFQVTHSGTETNLAARVNFLRSTLNSASNKVRWLGVLGRILDDKEYPRIAKAEFQGSGRVLKEWSAEGKAVEVQVYKAAALDLLLGLLLNPGSKLQALHTLAKHIFDVVGAGLVEKLKIALFELVGLTQENLAIDFLEKVKHVFAQTSQINSQANAVILTQVKSFIEFCEQQITLRFSAGPASSSAPVEKRKERDDDIPDPTSLRPTSRIRRAASDASAFGSPITAAGHAATHQSDEQIPDEAGVRNDQEPSL
jgi:hypothetical protein